MADRDLLELITALIADVCAVDAAAIRPEGKLIGYGLDSVRALGLLLALEDEVGVEISEHDPALRKVKTVVDLVELVARRRA